MLLCCAHLSPRPPLFASTHPPGPLSQPLPPLCYATHALRAPQNICEGYLNKLALGVRHKRRIRSWKKRYFVMQQEGEFYRLAYYTDKEKGQLKGTVEINTQMQVDISEMREHTFRMFDHTTEIVLQAPDDAERKKWMDAVNSSVQTLKKKGIGAVKKTKTKVKASKRGSVFTFEQPAGKPSQA